MKPKDRITAQVVAPPRGVTPEYGRYLSSNLSDCADCHTPRNLQDGQFYLDSLFAGSSFAFGEDLKDWIVSSYARNITPDNESGIGSWTEEQFIEAVTTGHRPDGTVLIPYMPYAYYKFWDVDDLRAVFTYLKTIAPITRTVPSFRKNTGLESARGVDRGRMLFQARCKACHGENGSGALATNVKLAEVSASLSDHDIKEFVEAGQMNLKMPPFGKTLSDEELNDIVAFIRTWENENKK